jgi:hypothetical protein
MKQAEQGCLLIGDLSGYTGYLGERSSSTRIPFSTPCSAW